MKKNDHSYFKNTECEYFPCHQLEGDDFNCMFCCCPLYALGAACGGNFTYTDKGVKDCSACTKPHGKDGYEYVSARLRAVSEIAKENRYKK
ncbi:MAG: metal-binding protein [Clostridia bacterium]|nr:metal-binding protein [Clostridia bacterium]